jgi:hypothetical protein
MQFSILMKNEGSGHLAVRQKRKMPGDYLLPTINCHRCHSNSESSSSIHLQISQSYVAKCKYWVPQNSRNNSMR